MRSRSGQHLSGARTVDKTGRRPTSCRSVPLGAARAAVFYLLAAAGGRAAQLRQSGHIIITRHCGRRRPPRHRRRPVTASFDQWRATPGPGPGPGRRWSVRFVAGLSLRRPQLRPPPLREVVWTRDGRSLQRAGTMGFGWHWEKVGRSD